MDTSRSRNPDLPLVQDKTAENLSGYLLVKPFLFHRETAAILKMISGRDSYPVQLRS
jgi:hypothetical protein